MNNINQQLLSDCRRRCAEWRRLAWFGWVVALAGWATAVGLAVWAMPKSGW